MDAKSRCYGTAEIQTVSIYVVIVTRQCYLAHYCFYSCYSLNLFVQPSEHPGGFSPRMTGSGLVSPGFRELKRKEKAVTPNF